MKINLSRERERGLTLVELVVVMVVIGFLTLILLNLRAPSGMQRARALRIQCVNNLKQVGLAYRMWEGDHADNYPMAVSETNGGTMEFTAGLNAFRHFQVMSNELSTPKILFCPEESDRNRFVGTNFVDLNNSNLSFFVGIDASETNMLMILSGDHNITNGVTIRNGLLPLTTNRLAGWTSKMHNKVGNILLADGSVQQDGIVGLQNQIAYTGIETNWMQMPVIGP